jgi:streptomycin 6-kinase
MTLDLPAVFINNVTQAYGSNGVRWLQDLPRLLDEAAHRWGLSLGGPFLLSYNYVCSATCPDGMPVVLKIGVPNRELTSEINALLLYDGRGACRLLEADADRGMLLEERLLPGTMLAALKNDDQATEIAAALMQKIQRPVSEPENFLSLRGWFDGLKGLRSRFNGTTGPFPPQQIATAEALLPDLFASSGSDVLLHGDFQHYNILLTDRGWLVTDPKGVVGPAEYEAGPLLMNPTQERLEETQAIQRTRRRLAILSERVGLDRERLLAWAICHSLLSSWWDLSEDGTGGEASRAWTEIFLKIQGLSD